MLIHSGKILIFFVDGLADSKGDLLSVYFSLGKGEVL